MPKPRPLLVDRYGLETRPRPDQRTQQQNLERVRRCNQAANERHYAPYKKKV